MIEQAGPERHVILVPVSSEEDLVLGRHAIQAAHALAGARVVLDLSALESWPGLDVRTMLEDLRRTTAGNRQALVALGRPSSLGLAGGAGDDVPFYGDLATCLRIEAPLAGRAYAIHLTLPARMDVLGPVKQHMASVVRALHGPPEAFQAEILLDEMALNAIENSPSSRNSWDLRFSIENLELGIEVTNDFDEAVDSTRIMNRRLQSFDDSGRYMGERGRGLFLIARIADSLQIRAVEGDRVRVTVKKRLEPGRG